VSTKYDYFHRNADDCLQMALVASSDAYRVSWLKVAQAWLEMIPADQIEIATQTFDAAVRREATHGKDFDSSHEVSFRRTI
jgi:hypothetical protein